MPFLSGLTQSAKPLLDNGTLGETETTYAEDVALWRIGETNFFVGRDYLVELHGEVFGVYDFSDFLGGIDNKDAPLKPVLQALIAMSA